MIVLGLVKIECFRDNLNMFWVIEAYVDSIAYSESFYRIDICFFAHIQFIKVCFFAHIQFVKVLKS